MPQAARESATDDGAALAAASRHLRDLLRTDQVAAAAFADIARPAQMLGLVSDLIAASERAAAHANVQELKTLAASCMAVDAVTAAQTHLERAAALAPDDADVLAQLGIVLFRCGRKSEAGPMLELALALDPKHAAAHKTLGSLKWEKRDVEGAYGEMSAAVAIEPGNADYRVSLGWALQARGQHEDAFLMLRSALEIDPNSGAAYSALADLFWSLRDFDRARKFYKSAADATPCAATITPYLFNLQSSPTHSEEEIFAEHVRLGGVFDSPVGLNKRHRNHPDPHRRLKVGFVSGDFYNHSVALFIEPVLRHLDRARFEIYGLHNYSVTDAVTERLRSLTDHWHACHGVSDQPVAEWIEAQRIDILIDLSGHTNRQRLGVFGLKPAPVQATYLGYPGTTGMRTMDYRITCELLDPTGDADRYHTETLIRLPGLLSPFQPSGDAAIVDPPCLCGAPFTFASMAPAWRVTPPVVAAWARILHALPQSRLMLANMTSPVIAKQLIAAFAEQGIDSVRLWPIARQSFAQYLELHGAVDLILDTFPYNGGTTNTYALWMGVPAIAFEGKRTSARVGAGVLREAGLDQFVARDADEYVALAGAWATRPEALRELRHDMRARLRVARVEEHIELAAQFGDALVEMWRAWCTKQNGARHADAS